MQKLTTRYGIMLLWGRLPPAGVSPEATYWVRPFGAAYLVSPAPKKLFWTLFSFTFSSEALKEMAVKGISESSNVMNCEPPMLAQIV